MEVIEIEKDLIPYEFEIVLNNKLYSITVNYNYLFDFFTMDLSLGDKILVQGEKLVLNQILFRSLYEDSDLNLDEDYPSDIIVPMASNETIERITFDNLGSEVLLYVVSREELFNE